MRDDLNIGRRNEQRDADDADAGAQMQADGASGAGAGDRDAGDAQGGDSGSGGGGAGPRGAAVEGAASGGAPPATGVAQRELDEQRDKYLRLAADFDNYRKRTARERQEAGARAQAELVQRLLDSIDDLHRVTAASAPGVNPQAIITGVDAVQKKLMRVLSGAGLEMLDPVDEPFNPELHEAVATEPALSPEDDHVIARVYQPGYVFQGQLLRPARVVVKQWSE